MQRAVHQEAAKQLSRHGSKQAVLESLRARNEYTKKYAKKQHKKAMADKQYQEQQGDLEMERHHFRTVTNVLMTARKAWREDWELGPLAPKRDIGVLAGLKYGSAALEHFAPSELESLALKRRKTRGELLRKYKVHDRVVVIAGKHKGRIGSLRDVNETNGYVRVNGINVVHYIPPEWRKKAEQNPSPVRNYEAPIPFDSIRLVLAVRDNVTGTTKELIVDKMSFGKRLVAAKSTDKVRIPAGAQYPIYVDGVEEGLTELSSKPYELEGHKWVQTRYIAGSDQEIFEIKGQKEDEVEEPYNDDDTLLIQTEEQSFIPPLMAAPMPMSVIDELRGKYSRFRDRHEDEYVEKKAEALEQRKEMMLGRERLMRTPLMELNERKAKIARDIEAKRELNDHALAKIGEAMARSSKMRTGAARPAIF